MKKLRPYLIILYFISVVIIGGIADGLMDEGIKVVGHILGLSEVFLLLSGAMLFQMTRRQIIALLVAYIGFRFALFDYAYNLTRGLGFFYNGMTSHYDNFLSKFPAHGITFARVIFLTLGIGVTFRELK